MEGLRRSKQIRGCRTSYFALKEKIKKFINARDKSEIVFTSGATDGLNRIIFGFFKKINNKLLSFIFGFSSGIMIASSFFSLLLSSLEEINIENKKQTEEYR